MSNISMRQLLEAGVHFGHNKRFWNPAMAEYIFGERQKIHIINLEKTLPLMRQAVEFVSGVAASRGRILFVGTKFAAREVLGEQARRCGMPYVDYRWLGGMLTNYKTIRQSVRRLKDLEAIAETKQYASFTKKEVLTLEREKTKLAASLSGIKDMGVRKRHKALNSAVKEYGSPMILKKLGAIKTYQKNKSPKVSELLYSNMKWLRKKYDGDFKSSWKNSSLFTKSSK